MATEGGIELEIVTPLGVVLRETVAELTAPSVAGEFGVLPGHLPILCALRTGIVAYKKGGEEHRFAVAPGFVEVAHDRAVVLTERFAKKGDVKPVEVRDRLRTVGEELADWQGDVLDPARSALIEEEQWLATQLELIGDPPQPTVREDTRFLESARREEPAPAEAAGEDDPEA